ncbi:Gap junction gamma-1 protein [Aix galericulata]|nr:Gap junction gamma-1 protein [Aix galericulata]
MRGRLPSRDAQVACGSSSGGTGAAVVMGEPDDSSVGQRGAGVVLRVGGIESFGFCSPPGAGSRGKKEHGAVPCLRFWVFQIILVATPSVMYLGYAIHKIARMVEHSEADRRIRSKSFSTRWKQHRGLEEAEDDHEEDPMMYPEIELESERENKEQPAPAKAKHDGRRRIREDGLMRIYVLQLLARTTFEIGFLVGFGTIRDTLNNKRKELEDSGTYNYPFTWNTPSAPPGYNIAVKPDQIQYTELSNAKMAYKQNKANIAQEQQYGSNEENIPADLENLQREIKVAQERLDLAIQAYNNQNNPSSSREKKSKAGSNKSSARFSLGLPRALCCFGLPCSLPAAVTSTARLGSASLSHMAWVRLWHRFGFGFSTVYQGHPMPSSSPGKPPETKTMERNAQENRKTPVSHQGKALAQPSSVFQGVNMDFVIGRIHP